jgi:ABC-2 type transport system permease protein
MMLRVARLAWPRLVRGGRGLTVALLLASPLAGGDPAGWYLDVVLPLAALIYAAHLIRDEVEGRTIVYLLSRPIARPTLLAGQFSAYLGAVLLVALPALTLAHVLWRGVPSESFLRLLAAASMALLAFGAVFTLMGVVLKRPLTLALRLLFGWERLADAPALLPRVTLTAYVRTLAGVPDAAAGVSPALAACVLVVVTFLALGAAAFVFTHREYVPEA